MAKIKTQYLIIGGFLIAVLLLSGALSQFGLASITGGGFTTLAVSKVDVQTDSQLNGQAYLVSLVPNSGGESFKGTLSASDIYQAVGITPKHSFTITANLVNQTCNYPLYSQGASIYTMSFCGYSCNPIVSSQPRQWQYTVSNTPQYNYKTEIILERDDGVKFTAYLDPQTTTANIGDVGRAKWVGNFVGTSACPDVADYAVVRDIVDNTAPKIVSLNSINALKATFAGTPAPYTEANAISYSSQYTTALNSKPYSWTENSQYGQISIASDNTGFLTYEPASPVVIPTIQLVIKADWLGVEVPAAQPLITYVSSPTFFESTFGTYVVAVKNTGGQNDSFDVKLECPISAQHSATRIAVNAGETKTAELKILSGTAGSYFCQMSAYSVNDATKKHSIPVNVMINKEPCPYSCCANTIFQEKPCDPNVRTTTNCFVADSNSTIPAGISAQFTNEELAELEGFYCITKSVEMVCSTAQCVEGNIIAGNASIYPTATVPTTAEIPQPTATTIPLPTDIGEC